MKCFSVHYYERAQVCAEVMAEDKEDAIARVKAGEFIEGTVDSEPGKHDFRGAWAEEVERGLE